MLFLKKIITNFTKKSILSIYLVQSGVGKYLQKGYFNSKVATFLNAYFAASIIFCGSDSGGRLGSKQPSRTSKDTLPMP